MELPRFAVMRKNALGDWEFMTIYGLATYEQAKAAMERHRSRGYAECYMVALAFIAGPQTDFKA